MSLALLPIFIGGCSIFGSTCIKTALVTNLSTTPLSSVIKGDTRVVTISAFKGGCGGSSPQLPGGEGDIGISLALTAPEAKHPTGRLKKVAFPIFVALLDEDDNVLDRYDEIITATINNASLNHTHQIIYRPPPGINVESEDHRILVGFNGEAKALASSLKAYPSVRKSPCYKGKLKRKKI